MSAEPVFQLEFRQPLTLPHFGRKIAGLEPADPTSLSESDLCFDNSERGLSEVILFFR